MLRLPGLFVALFAGWLLWSGHYTAMLVGLGLASCLAALWLAARMVRIDGEPLGFDLVAHLRHLVLYWPWLIKEIAKANLDVLRIVLARRVAVDPVLIEVPSGQASAMAEVIYANSITLTPGTVTVDAADGRLTVHCLTQTMADGVVEGTMERRVAALERPA